MTLLLGSTLLLLVVVPGLLMLWLLQREGSLTLWGVKATAVSVAVFTLFYLGNWHMLSYYGRYALLIALAAVLLFGVRRMRDAPGWKRPRGAEWISPLLAAGLIAFVGVGLIDVVRARDVPADPIDLAPPLRDGVFYVANGGSQPLLNPHMQVAAPGQSRWRGQRWALDIVALYPTGRRAHGILPSSLDDYAVFGVPVYAPCTGRVVAAVDAHPDLAPPRRDTTHKAGNYVLLRCAPEAYVLLAHLQRRSVAVSAGDSVAVGARLGAIGNSGNSWEPHLHISAQRQPGAATILDADPRPITVDGRFLVRNDLIRAAAAPAQAGAHSGRRP